MSPFLYLGQYFNDLAGFGVHKHPETAAGSRGLGIKEDGLVTSTAEEFFQFAGRFCIMLLEHIEKFLPLPVILVVPDMIVLQNQVVLSRDLAGDLDVSFLGFRPLAGVLILDTTTRQEKPPEDYRDCFYFPRF